MSHEGSQTHDARNKRTPGFGCCGIAGLLVILIIAVAASRLLWPPLWGKVVTGKFRNAVAVRGSDGDPLLWILADGSFRYVKRTQRPGLISVESKCAFCKTWTYVYDPFRRTVRAKFRTDFEAVVLRTWMVYVKGKVWVVVAPYKENPATILVYNADPPRLIQETSELVAKYPELSSGVIDLRLENDPPRIVLNTRDGRSGLILALGDEKLYASDVAYRKTLPEADRQQMTVLALGRVDNGPRRRLYRVTGPRNRITESSLEFALMNPSTLMGANKVTVEAVSPERDYIEGVLFLQDVDGGLILHQDAAGKKANRLLTRVGGDGKERWTTTPADFFKELGVDTDRDAMSAIFFMKSHLSVSRTGNLVLLQLEDVGVIGFDFETGRKLWEIRP